MGYTRPIPDDFVDMAKRWSVHQLAKHYHAGFSTVMKWLEIKGLERKRVTNAPPRVHKRRPIPDDFTEVAAVKGIMAMAKHYRTSHDAIRRWLEETGARRVEHSKYGTRPVPDDFAKVAPSLYKKELMAHYGAGLNQINRWLERSGVRCRQPAVIATMNRWQATAAIETVRTIHDCAADTLRRNRWVVYRCDDKGRANPKGRKWRVGNVVCDGDELLARAARYERAA